MIDRSDLLQERLDQNYKDYVAGLQGKTAGELIELAPEITAAQQLRDELACACSEEVVEHLLRLDDPLAEMRGFWADQQDGSHSEEIGRMICELQNRGLIPDMDIEAVPAIKIKKQAVKKEKHHNER